jgi:hypothetical protein
MARDDQAQSEAQQLSTRPTSPEPDRTVLRVYEWRGGVENRYVESVVEWHQGRGFALYEIKPDGSRSEPLKELRKRVAQRLSLFDGLEMPGHRKPPLLLLDIRQLDSLKLAEDDTVVIAIVEIFCFFGVTRPGSVLLEVRLKAESSQVTLTMLEVRDIENGSPNARAGIGAPVVLNKAGLDLASPPNLQMVLPYDLHFPDHFLKQRIGLDLGQLDNDLNVNRARWQLVVSFPKLGDYLTPAGPNAPPPERNFRTIRFDVTTHKFSSRRGGDIRLAGFLTHGEECSADSPAAAEKSITIASRTGLRHSDFPASFTITQRAPLSIGAAPKPAAPGGKYVVNECLLHLRGVPGAVVPDQWNALLSDYFHALAEVQGGRPISFAPTLDPVDGGTAYGFWTLTYRIEDRWPRDNTSAPENAYYAISLHQQPEPGFAQFTGKLESVKALDQSPIGPIMLRLRSSDPPDAFERMEIEQGIVLETPYAIGLDPTNTAAPGPLDSHTIRMGALDLEFSGQGDLKDTNQAINKLLVRPEPCRVSVHIQAEFALKRILPGGQDDPDGEEYVPENQLNAGFMSACLTGVSNNLLSTAEQNELKIEAGFQRKRPLVIVPDRPNQPTGTYVLSVTEDVQAAKNQTVSLKVLALAAPSPVPPGVDPSNPCDAVNGSGFVDVVVLDSNPFLVAKVRAQPFSSPDLFKGTAVASWTNVGSVNWQIKSGNNPFCLVLPPQGVGEEMEKEHTIAETALAKYNFSPPARLQMNANLVAGNFAEAPWNLRRLLGVSGEASTGPALSTVQFEMLYGMFCSVAPQAMQLADVFSLVGHIAPRRSPDMRWKSAEIAAYYNSRVGWSNLYRRYLSRIAVLQPWQALQSQTPVLKDGMICTLRSNATANPFQAGSPGLKGGALWGVESLNIYSVLVTSPEARRSGPGTAEIADPAFSALGGWGHQKAKFNQNLTIINADVAMGRTYRYKLERIGRIGVWWNLAKHVIVYERTVAPSRQFYQDQSHLLGRPVLRKIREYIEILEDTRTFPDTVPGSQTVTTKDDPDAARRRRGFVEHISFPKGAQYNVRGSWGGDVSAGDGSKQTLGWKVPLWHAGATPADVYPKPKVALGLHAQAANDPVIVPGEIDDPENLCFFTLTKSADADPNPDPHAWDPFPDVDYSVIPLSRPDSTDFSGGSLQQITPDEPGVPAGHGPCTFHLTPQSLPVNLAKDRTQQPLSAVLRTVTMARATLKSDALGDAAFKDIRAIVGLPANANAAVAGVLSLLPPLTNPDQTLPGAVVQDLKQKAAAAIKKLTDPLDQVQTKLTDELSTLRTNLTNLETQRFADLRKAVDAVRARLDEDVDKDVTPAVMALNEWKTHFTNQVLRKVEDGVMQLETASGSLQHLLLKYAEMAVALIDGVGQSIDRLKAAVSSGAATLTSDALEAVRQIRDLEARLRAAGQQRPLNWLPDPTEYILSQLALGDLDQRLTAIEQAARTGQAQLNAAINAFPTADWVKANFDALGRKLVSKFLTDTGTYTREAIVALLEKEGHAFEHWRDDVLDHSASLKTLSDLLTQALQSNDPNVIKTQVKAAVDQYFNSKVTPLLDTLQSDMQGQTNKAFGILQSAIATASSTVKQLADGLTAALEQKAGQIADAVLKAGRDLGQNATEYCDKHFRSLLPQGFAPPLGQLENAADKTAQLVRAFGEPPVVPNLDFGRGAMAYYYKQGFDEVNRRIGITPVLAEVNKARQIAGAAEGVLQSVGVKLPTKEILDSLIPASLKNFDISSIFPDFAGLKLTNLFSGLKLPDINQNNVKVTHDVDPQSRRATVRADIDFPINETSTVFTIGPLSLDLLSAQFTASVKIDAQGTTVRRTVNANITGKWQLSIGGMALLKLNGTALRFDDSGSVRFEISPDQIELPGIMSFVNELLKDTGGGSDGLSMGPIAGGYQCVLSLPVPDMQGATTGISNLTLGARLALLYAPRFQFRLGFFLATKEAPFSLTAFILGGGGYLECDATYTPGSGQLVCTVNLAITASASLAIALGPIKGGVYVYLGITASFQSAGENPGLTIGALLLIRGTVDLLGIVTACVSLLLEARYEGHTFKARGELSISIKICWCFTLNIHESVEYSVSAPGGGSSGIPRVGSLLASLDAAPPFEPAGDDFNPAKYATEYTNMLV